MHNNNYKNILDNINKLSKEERNMSITELVNRLYLKNNLGKEQNNNVKDLVINVIAEFQLNKQIKWNEKIKILREKYNYSQEKAAQKCNVSRKTYWAWENGISYPYQNNQISIANAFNVNLEDIFDIY